MHKSKSLSATFAHSKGNLFCWEGGVDNSIYNKVRPARAVAHRKISLQYFTHTVTESFNSSMHFFLISELFFVLCYSSRCCCCCCCCCRHYELYNV